MTKRHPLRIAHLSDLHLGTSMAVREFEKMVAAMQSQGVDHVILSGDICNYHLLSQEADARAVRDILLDYGYSDWERATVIPGNHDIHGLTGVLTSDDEITHKNLHLFFQTFGRFLRRKSRQPRFPIVKDVRGLRMFCFDSTVLRSRWWSLRYRICNRQLKKFGKALKHTPQQLMKLVVVHHYPYRIRLRDVRYFGFREWFEDQLWLCWTGWRKFVKKCVKHDVDYILHGHTHASPAVGFEGAKLLALGQGTTGSRKDFSIYHLEGPQQGQRLVCRLNPDAEVERVGPLAPDLLVDDWAV